MLETYNSVCFENEVTWSDVPKGKLEFFQWESEKPYRPETFFQMCFLEEKGIFLKMETDETDIRTECKGRDDNCWEDSCMEFFFKPFEDREEYLNFEISASGSYLCAVGKDRFERVFLKELSNTEPTVKTEINKDGWELELFVPCKLIDEVFKKHFSASNGTYRGNFYKCGDKTEIPHFGSFSPMGELPPGFHNPELFAKIITNNSKKGQF